MILQEIRDKALEYKQDYDSGALSSSEFKELIGDLNLNKIISDESDELSKDIITHQIFTDILQIAAAIK